MRELVFLTRRGCSLCEQARPRVRAAARSLGLRTEVVDVDEAGLADRYGGRVPVVLAPDHTELASGRISVPRLLWRLLRHRLRLG
jgi:hypothetical protein